MAYDEELSQRMRDMLGGLPGLSEKKMMGSVCFLLDGNMVGGANRDKAGRGRLMFRVGKEAMAEALAIPGTPEIIHGTRKLGGFIHADEEMDEAKLRDLMSMSVTFAGSLPPK